MRELAIAVVLLFIGFIPLAGGCASTARDATPALPERPREAVSIFDREGGAAPWSAMLQEVETADVIIIGETHGHPLGLEASACLWDDVLATHPDAALLLEFFERDRQVAIDDYMTGITDEEGFRKASGRTSGNYPPGHERMVEAAKAADAPVYAANAPRRYIRRASPDGYEELLALGDAQRRLFVVPDALPEGRYREEFFDLMSGADHGPVGEGGGMPTDMVERMYRSQSMWDATMADTVIRAVNDGHRPAVLVIGRFHSDFEGGTVQMIRRARPDLEIRTLSMVTEDGPSEEDDDIERADFVVYVGGDHE